VNPDLNAGYWSRRYQEGETAWDTGSITTPLKVYLDQLKNKNISILIPGAGNAYEADYLTGMGFKNVSVCDFAAEPLENLKARCPAFNPEHLLQNDFFELEGSFDLVVEQTFFCALQPALRRRYFEKIRGLLKPGGKLVGLLFNDPLNTNKPPFGGNKEEYRNYFEGLFTVQVYAECYNSIGPRAGRELFINLTR
jgi:methyl halide transferase